MSRGKGEGTSAEVYATAGGLAAGRVEHRVLGRSPSLRSFYLYYFYPAARSFAARPGGASGTST
ncbi:MAG: hypothetical protein M0Z80_04360 [Treponema sp.]|nr:hypothetical protein [Treponema sp.]